MELGRRDGETPLQHHRRLVYGKLVDKTLEDADYTELAIQLYGRSYASDVARRMIYGSRRTLELVDDQILNGISGDTVYSDVLKEMAALKKEKQQYYDQRRELNKLLSNDARRDHMYEYLEQAANDLNETVGIQYLSDDLSDWIDSPHLPNDAVLVLSDWHYGLVADNVFNQYNTSICKDRVKKVFEKALIRTTANNCENLHIIVLGDLIHGAIHTSARVASEELVCDQIMQVAEILAQSIEWIAQYIPHVDISMTYGNHGRTVQVKDDNIHRDNMERVILWWLRQRLAPHKNIIVNDESDNEFLFLNVRGHVICASHGDLDSVTQSPRLLGTLFAKKYGVDVEYILLGDKHHHESFEELGITAMICGSLCGADDYANKKRLFSRPEQLLLIVNEEDGVDAEYRLSC